MKHEHVFTPSKIENYEICIHCGSYHSTAQVDPKTIYEDQNYWDTGDGKTGRSTLEQQCENFVCIDDCGISKVDRIFQFVPDGKTALEIACAPGVILKKLTEKEFDACGVEPSVQYIPFILGKAPKANVLHGYFPAVTTVFSDDFFDCIIAIDIMEHVDNYEGFFNEVKRLLTKGGTAVVMSPIILADGLFRNIDFDYPDQHCWIHTQKFLEPYLKDKFSDVKFSRWIVGHEIIICKK